MGGLGSGDNGEWTFMDIIALIGAIVGFENLDMNISQGDLQNAENRLSEALQRQVLDIHNHLEEQDIKINKIMEKLYENSGTDI